MKAPMLRTLALTALGVALAAPQARAQSWQPVRGETQLRELMSDTVFEGTLSGGRPWKFQVQYWNYVKTPDAFAPEHQLRLSISPVVSTPWNKGK